MTKQNKYYYKDGTTSSRRNDTKVLHRLDGPAFEYADGDKYWYVDGKKHRLDGPATEYANGDKHWWVDGKYLTEEEFEKHPLRIKWKCDREIEKILED